MPNSNPLIEYGAWATINSKLLVSIIYCAMPYSTSGGISQYHLHDESILLNFVDLKCMYPLVRCLEDTAHIV